jgi:hypothetical protein
MLTDTATYIASQVKLIMQIISEIDTYDPEEDLLEVLIGRVTNWGAVEVQLLFPTLEAALEGSEAVTDPARERLNKLDSMQESIHLGEGAEAPLAELAKKYVDAVKYHLIVDVQDVVPLAVQLDPSISRGLANEMADMQAEQW